MMTMNYFVKAALTLLTVFSLFTACKDDGNDLNVKGTAQFEITDGPADDPAVKGVFVTVTSIKVDGKVIRGFNGPQTIDLMAYQEGKTKLLGVSELEAGSYQDVSLVLNYATDVNGASPGCYVLTTDNVKHSLQATAAASGEIKPEVVNFTIEKGSTTNLVLDFDLRKSLRYESEVQPEDHYNFVTDTELRSALRLVTKAETGKIQGNCQDNLAIAGDKIVVYAYKKGTFNKDTELQGQGQSQIRFRNAVASATVNAQGNYTLSFLEEGAYELHFVGYEDKNNDGRLEVKGELALSLTGNLGIDLHNIDVEAGSNVSLSLLVTGILP